MAIEPHGGKLVNRFVSENERQKKIEQTRCLKKILLDEYLTFDLDCIAKGIFSPLEGFMGEEETVSSLETMHIRKTIPWTIPILLDVP